MLQTVTKQLFFVTFGISEVVTYVCGSIYCMEIQYAYLSKTPVFYKNEIKSLEFIELNKQRLIGAYQFLLNKLEKEEIEYQKIYDKKCLCLKNKICLCGSKLKWIDGYAFWGCISYKDKTNEHITFIDENQKIWKDKIRISSNWVALLIKDLGLKGKIQAKFLADWFKKEGYIDLAEKCGYTPYNYDGYITTNEKSKEQEKEWKSILNEIFDKVIYQQCIKYKLVGEDEKFCIPDFICSLDGVGVFVIDCKLNEYLDDEKSELYLELIKKILLDKGDVREVCFLYATNPFSDNIDEKTSFSIVYKMNNINALIINSNGLDNLNILDSKLHKRNNEKLGIDLGSTLTVNPRKTKKVILQDFKSN